MKEGLLAATFVLSMAVFQPLVLLIHEAGHARAAERHTTGPVEMRVRGAHRELRAAIIRRLFNLERTSIWISLKGLHGGVSHDGPEGREEWVAILRGPVWPLRIVGFAVSLVFVGLVVLWPNPWLLAVLGGFLLDIGLDRVGNGLLRLRPSRKHFGTDAWHLARCKKVPGYLPPVFIARARKRTR